MNIVVPQNLKFENSPKTENSKYLENETLSFFSYETVHLRYNKNKNIAKKYFSTGG